VLFNWRGKGTKNIPEGLLQSDLMGAAQKMRSSIPCLHPP